MRSCLLLLIGVLLFTGASAQQALSTLKNHQKPASTALLKPAKLVSSPGFIVPDHRTCLSVEIEQKLQEKYPSRLSDMEFEKALERHLLRRQNHSNSRVQEEVLRIPVIVHVVHHGEAKGTGANISAAQVYSQFEVLNEDFRRTGAGSNSHQNGADVYIEFEPAYQDPQGNSIEEPGINRVERNNDYWEYNDIEERLKPATIWDPEQYLNIWVVEFGGREEGTLGYAQFPSFSGLDGLSQDEGLAETDGVVVGYRFFGRVGNVQYPFDQGRTATHEVGHWLGLRHIWGDGDCDEDDFCADTPPAADFNGGCAYNDSCTEDDLPDMIENYMDYTDDACMNVFTIDQKARMRTVLEVSPRRKTLWGPSCSDAEPAVAGTNTAVPSAWYTYTADAEQIVTISSIGQTSENTHLSLYTQCGLAPINENDDAFGMMQSELSTLLQAGESVIILWSGRYSDEAFEWVLSTSAPEDAAVCELAIAATEGTNTVPETGFNTYWFTFSVEQDDIKINISAEERSYAIYKNSCTQLELIAAADGTETVFDIVQGDEIFLAFETADGGDFSWTMEVAPLGPGEVCKTAVEAQEGTSTTPAAPYWFTYTVPQHGHVLISSGKLTAVETYIQVYEACTGSLLQDNVETGSRQSEVLLENLEAGTELMIFWDSVYSTDGFDWSLVFDELDAGEICTYPSEMAIGINAIPATDLNHHWALFTMPEAGKKIVVTAASGVDVIALTNECRDPEVLANDSTGVEIYGVGQGEEVLLLLEFDNGGGFDLEIALEELDEGEVCGSALLASEGENTAPRAPQWYSFTMPVAGDLFVSSVNFTEEDTYLTVYDECGGSILAESDDYEGLQSAALVEGLVENQTVYIYWVPYYSNHGFDWELQVKIPAPGDKCESPVEAQLGTNSVPESEGELYWTSFTMPQENSKLVISSSSKEWVGVLNTDCNDLFAYGISQENLVVAVEKNQQVLIVWELVGGGGFDWELKLAELSEGDSCEDPLEAVSGKNEAGYAPLWYSFTMPEDGDLIVSSVGFTEEDTYLYIMDGCGGSLKASNDDYGDSFQSQVLLQDVAKGETVIIYWSHEYSSSAFEWNLITPNQAPEMVQVPEPITLEEDAAEVTLITDMATVFKDPEEEALTFGATGDQAKLQVTLTSANEVRVRPVKDFNGPAIVTISANDGKNTTTEEVLVTVNAVNDAPEFTLSKSTLILDQDFDTPEIIEIFLRTPPADEAEEIVGFTISPEDATLVQLVIKGTQIEIASLAGMTGEQTFTIEANDGQVISATHNETFSVMVEAPLGLEDKPKVRVFPNPVENSILVESPTPMEVTIYDLSGALLTTGVTNQEIDLSGLPQGTYLINVVDSNGKILTHRIIKKSNF